MHATVAVRYGQDVSDSTQHVVSIQHRVLANLFQPVGSVREDVTIRANENPDVAEKATNPPDGQRSVVVEIIFIIP